MQDCPHLHGCVYCGMPPSGAGGMAPHGAWNCSYRISHRRLKREGLDIPGDEKPPIWGPRGERLRHR